MVKIDGKTQHIYPRNNWSSMIVFNNRHPNVQALTPEVVNSVSPACLHRFSWVTKEEDIGALDLTWNFLEGECPVPAQTSTAIHYTNGGPWFAEWQDAAFGDLWRQERDAYEATLKAAA